MDLGETGAPEFVRIYGGTGWTRCGDGVGWVSR